MPINSREIIYAVSTLTEDKNVKVCMKESFKGGCIAAFTTVVGGLLMGPPGLAIGGTIGGCTAAMMSKSFKSVPRVINDDMTNEQRDRLAQSVSLVLRDLRIEDATVLLPLLLNDSVAKEAVIKAVLTFLQNEMQLQIID
ncbi:hypothetical protein C0J52_08933 [Blattella germanica]|nr:hypothetical protein C0J52_08933 [Blattella germanica]